MESKIMTATQLILQAALKSGYRVPQVKPVGERHCWLCGGETAGRGLPTREIIKPTFMDYGCARVPSSTVMCRACVFCLGERKLRNCSILATPAGLRHPTRSEWRDVLLGPPDPPWVGTIAVTGQKHLSFKAPVNYGRNGYTVLLEETPVSTCAADMRLAVEAVEDMLAAGFTRSEIRLRQYPPHKIGKCGLAKWEAMAGRIDALRQRARLLELALHVARKEEAASETALAQARRADQAPVTSLVDG